jgi:pimeloyl-ACP methyl ester carboxylesterase
LAALLDSLKLTRIHLIVHDWGGPIGLGACLSRHAKLGKVVILNTAAFADIVVPWRIRFCRVPVVGEIAVRAFNGFAGPATWMAVTKPLPQAVKRGFLFPYDSWANRIATHRFVRDIPTGKGGPSDLALARVEGALPMLTGLPVRIIWGADDFCFNRHYFERWRHLLPQAMATLLPGTGHYLLEDSPAEVLDLISKHLAEP